MMLTSEQSLVLSAIRNNARTAKKAINRKTLNKLLRTSALTDYEISAALKKLVKEGYLRVGVSFQNVYVLIKWD